MDQALRANVVIRRVGLNRIKDLLALEEASFPTDRISRRNLRNLLRSQSACCVGAYLAGQLVGSMVILFRRNTHVARIYSIAVAPSVRNMGLGRKMMLKAEREAKAHGCERLRLEVRLDNTSAIRLYESLGFEDSKILPGYYEDGAHGMVYRKKLR